MSELPEKCCGRCKWFDDVSDGVGLCFAPIPPLPIAANLDMEPMNADEGLYCECFEPKEPT